MRAQVLMAAAIALSTQLAAPDQTAFRAGVDVVRVDVSVLDRDRRPVRGLAAGDFEIFENGKPRPILALASVDVPAPLVESPSAAGWMREVAPDVADNQSRDVRRIAIVMDDAMTFPDPRVLATAKAVARRIVDRLGPGDQAAIVFTYFPGAAQPFTMDRAKLFAAIDRFRPRYKITVSRQFGIDFDDAATYASARTLSNIADYLIGVPDRRKAIAFISPGAAVNSGALSPRGDEDLAIVEMRQVLERTARANVTLFGFDPTGAEGAASYLSDQLVAAGLGSEAAFELSRRQATLEQQFVLSTSDNTGGSAIRNTDNFEPGVSAMFEQLSSYYLIGFQPADPKKDGALRRVDVKVRRPGLIIQARQTYYATKSGGPTADASGAASVDRALRSPDMSAGVSLRAAASVFAQEAKKTSRIAIVVGVDLPRSNDGRRLVEKADVLVRAFDSDGKARATRAVSVDVALRPTTVPRSYYEILTDIELTPGRYELRLGVRSAAQDRIGTIFRQIDVPDYSKAALSLSDVMFSTIPPLHAAPANAFAGMLPIVPTASREFPRSIAVRAFTRVYREGSAPNGDVTIKTTVTNASGTTVMDEPRVLTRTQFAGSRSADLSIEVPVSRLPAGEYLLRVQAQSGETTTHREIRFVVIE